jgi:ATP adenylyltransferase
VPRWGGDTNFMPILANTKVISQSLDALYDLLMKHLQEDSNDGHKTMGHQ